MITAVERERDSYSRESALAVGTASISKGRQERVSYVGRNEPGYKKQVSGSLSGNVFLYCP